MKKVFIAGGGTGGHFYPASALPNFLKEKNYHIYYFGTKSGIEAKKDFPANQIFLFDMKAVRVRGFFRKIKGALSLLSASFKIYKIIKKEKPDFIICFGGYTSFPLGLAGFLSKTKIYIHEQNSVPSYTNKILSFFAKKIFITFPITRKYFPEEKTYLTGLPLRSSLKERLNITKEEARKQLNLPTDKKVILIFGGSQGAKKLNQTVNKLAELFKDYFFIHIQGKHKVELKEKPQNIISYEYFDDMGLLYKASDLVISRAGSATVNEILAFGKKAIFIPFPYATSDHQYYNVKWLEDKGVCKILLEKNIEKLPEILNDFLDKDINEKEIQKLAILNAEEKIYSFIVE